VLVATLASAVARLRAAPEWLVAIAGALLLLGVGAIGSHGARAALAALGPTVGFLAALLVIAEACRREGVFRLLAAWIAERARGRGGALFGAVFAAATAVTVVLGLDATIVLLVPIVIVTVRSLEAPERPSLYACAYMANAGSLLLPVSNLTNLLAFRASGLSFTRFAAVMALPWAVAVALEWVVLRWAFRAELARPIGDGAAQERERADRGTLWALGVLAAILLGFALSSLIGVAPVWIAAIGAIVIALPSAARGGTAGLGDFARSAQPGFLAFVLALGVIVRALADHGVHRIAVELLPGGGGPGDLILVALVSAAFANVLNNLPATLILIPVATSIGLGPLLAVLVGVNLGPNLTYVGSLATLLWRRILHQEGEQVSLPVFVRLGALSTLPGLVIVPCALWLGLHWFG
jgi:arsenical pump membrane protein